MKHTVHCNVLPYWNTSPRIENALIERKKLASLEPENLLIWIDDQVVGEDAGWTIKKSILGQDLYLQVGNRADDDDR